MAKEFAGHAPLNAMMGWTDGVESKNDAVELAKGFISRRFTAQEASWYAVAPFMGGWLWEAHEGGPGRGYIASVVDALSQNPDGTFWFPSSDRAFQVMMRDGKPFGILLSKAESLPVMNSGQPPLAATAKMSPAVRKGTATFATGAAMLGSGVAFLALSMAFYAISANPGPGLRAVDFSSLPHAQWGQVSGTQVEEIVSKLEMSEGKWRVERRPHVIEGLREIREEGQRIIQNVRESAATVPRVEDEPSAGVRRIAPGASPAQPAADPRPAPEAMGLSPAERRRLARGRDAAQPRPPSPQADVPQPPDERNADRPEASGRRPSPEGGAR